MNNRAWDMCLEPQVCFFNPFLILLMIIYIAYTYTYKNHNRRQQTKRPGNHMATTPSSSSSCHSNIKKKAERRWTVMTRALDMSQAHLEPQVYVISIIFYFTNIYLYIQNGNKRLLSQPMDTPTSRRKKRAQELSTLLTALRPQVYTSFWSNNVIRRGENDENLAQTMLVVSFGLTVCFFVFFTLFTNIFFTFFIASLTSDVSPWSNDITRKEENEPKWHIV